MHFDSSFSLVVSEKHKKERFKALYDAFFTGAYRTRAGWCGLGMPGRWGGIRHSLMRNGQFLRGFWQANLNL